MNGQMAIGIDVGGTKIAGAIVTAEGSIVVDHVVPTPQGPDGADPGGEATTALVNQLLAGAEERRLEPVAIGIGVPEYVTPDGRIASAEVVDWPSGAPAFAAAAIPTVIESDVRCSALAELRCGAGARPTPGSASAPTSFLFVSVGTGISHTLVIEERIWPGHRGEALALGELPVRPELTIRPDAPLTVEQQASGRALGLVRSERAVDGIGGHTKIGGHVLAEALASAVRIVDPELIILGGGLGTSDGAYIDALRSHYTSVMAARPDPPPLRRSALGDRGGRIGAALVAIDRHAGDGGDPPPTKAVASPQEFSG